MRRIIRPAVTVFCFIVSGVSLGQKAETILDRVEDAYTSLQTFDFHGTIRATVTIDGVQNHLSIPVEMAQGNTPAEGLQVSFRLPSWTTADGVAENAPAISFVPPDMHSVQIADNVKSASVLREEKLEANGKAVPCYVVDVLQSADAGPEHRTVWIDKTTFLVLRIAFRTAESAKGSQPALPFDWVITFTSYQLNETPPDWLVELGQKAEKGLAKLTARMIGMQAPVFKLQDLNGREVSLDNLHGKVVLLTFWDTWCGPCQSELPLLAKLERDWSAKGLALIRITDEPPEPVNRFLKRTHQSFATLVNGTAVKEQYSVRAVPTLIVVDQSGKIVAYDVSELNEPALLERLKRAGLE